MYLTDLIIVLIFTHFISENLYFIGWRGMHQREKLHSEASANEDEESPVRSPSPVRSTSEQNPQSGQSSDDVQEVFNDAREQEVSLELEMAAKRKRKELRAKKRATREAKAKALKSKHSTPSTPISNPETNYNTPSGSAAREAREQKETAKRKTLLAAACRSELVSSEISSSEDDESAQCSNLQAIAMVENESRRYEISTLIITTDIKPFRLETERIKRAQFVVRPLLPFVF